MVKYYYYYGELNMNKELKDQLKRIARICSHDAVENCSCGLSVVPINIDRCPRCGSVYEYDFEIDEEFEPEFEIISFEESEL